MGVYVGAELGQKDLLDSLIYELKDVPVLFPGDTELKESIGVITEIFKKRIAFLVEQAIQREKQTKASLASTVKAGNSPRPQQSLRGVDGPDTFWDTSGGRCELVMP